VSYDRAIACRPDYAEAHYNRGGALEDLLRLDDAKGSYEAALRINPDYAGARWALAFLTIPPLSGCDEPPEAAQVAFGEELLRLEAWFAPAVRRQGPPVVGTRQPFYLAYREVACRDVLARYGELCQRLMEPWQGTSGFRPPARRSAGEISIGIVSETFRDHSVWNAIVRGWLLYIDPARFALTVYHVGIAGDAQTELARTKARRYVEGARSLTEWSRTIAADEPDVLIYPDVGMSPITAQLANLRLAPVQMAAWGHPQTTGFPTIDYYLSAADFEPEDAQNSYTEKLVALPNLGCSYARQAVVPTYPDLAALGLEAGVPLLLCPGQPFKYASQHDWIFPEITKRAGKCRFVFFESRHKWMSAALRERLTRAFADAGLLFDVHATFVRWLKRGEFHGLMERADVFLDTIGFSGFNTAMQAVECCLPIVSLEGRFMRGRFASAIMKRMGLHELVAATEEEYIERAVRMVRDRGFRDAASRRMREKQVLLFDDPAPIRALEALLTHVCRPPQKTDR
jgi:protein O-GlcNAc transferase